MRLTQGTFSFLPDLSDEQIATQIKYCLDQGWAVNVEHTDDPHPRNSYWELWDLPMFDLKDPAGVMLEVNACRDAVPNQYVRVSAFDANRGVESLRLSFIVNRPAEEPGFHVERMQMEGRSIRYTVRSYAAREPAGQRYPA
jgi:ribulose-bisphosphate carboxylase small chain